MKPQSIARRHPPFLPLSSGQTSCFNEEGREIPCSGTGQDGESRYGFAWPVPRFEVHGEAVKDLLTGLVWLRNANCNEFPLTWQEALDLAADMNAKGSAGYKDWRLPNRRELHSLVSYQAKKPALPDEHPFKNVFLGWYWSATSAAINPSYAWCLHMEGARMFYGRKDQYCLFWPVRGESIVLAATGQKKCFDSSGKEIPCRGSGQDGNFLLGLEPHSPRFIEEGEIVHDRFTGLIWLKKANFFGKAASWRQAFEKVNRLNEQKIGRRRDWRLPSINALESLVDCSSHSPALSDGHPFAEVQEVYWSSTSSFFEPDWAWALYLNKGALGVGYKPTSGFAIWPVCYS